MSAPRWWFDQGAANNQESPVTGRRLTDPSWIVVCLLVLQIVVYLQTIHQETRVITQLINYDAAAQHMGTWLFGYDWNVCGCGTFREPVSEVRAQALMKRYVERLARKLHSAVSYFAALERRYSGCGHSPVPVHWHFLASSIQPTGMASVAERLWGELFGDAKVDPYDSSSPGAYYVCKLASHQNCTILLDGMERLNYNGPTDLIAAAHENPHVPGHLKDKVFGEYLRLRPMQSDLAVVEPYKHERGRVTSITNQIGIQQGDWNSENAESFTPDIQSEPKITHAALKVVRSMQLRITSPSAPPGKPRPAEHVEAPRISACDSRHAASHGVLWQFRNAEVHKPVWIPPSH